MSSENERKLTRRRFLEHSAMATAMTATWYSVAMKTDAQMKMQQQAGGMALDPGTGPSPYAYDEVSS